MPLPNDPHQPHQPHQPYPPAPPPPPHPQQYPYPPPQRTVTKRTIGGTTHTVHLVLTICTCGLWGIVWLLHWLLGRSKTVSRS